MQLNIVPNFVFFIISVICTLYSVIYYQNYIIKSDYMYISSINSNILYYLIVITIYCCNTTTLYLQTHTLFLSLACIWSLSLLYWYLAYGKTLFIYSLSRNLLLMIVSLSILFGFLAAECYMYENFDLNMKSLTKMLSILFIVFLSLKSLE